MLTISRALKWLCYGILPHKLNALLETERANFMKYPENNSNIYQ